MKRAVTMDQLPYQTAIKKGKICSEQKIVDGIMVVLLQPNWWRGIPNARWIPCEFPCTMRETS